MTLTGYVLKVTHSCAIKLKSFSNGLFAETYKHCMSCIRKNGIFLQGKVICHRLDWFGNFSAYQYPTILSHLQNTVTILTTLWAAMRHNWWVLLKSPEILQRMQSGNKIIVIISTCGGLTIFISILHYTNDWFWGFKSSLEYRYKSENSSRFGIPQWYQELHYFYQCFCFCLKHFLRVSFKNRNLSRQSKFMDLSKPQKLYDPVIWKT